MAKEVTEIAKYLEDYDEFKGDTRKIPIGTRVAYFRYNRETEKAEFRRGGRVYANDEESEAIGFMNFSNIWFTERDCVAVWVHKKDPMSAAEKKKFRSQINKFLKVSEKIKDTGPAKPEKPSRRKK